MHRETEARVGRFEPFSSRRRYGAFLQVQRAFLAGLEPLYRSTDLARIVPDLADRSRLAAIEADLADLGLPAEGEPGGADRNEADSYHSLGRLYVSEGSKLGAALLLKEAAVLGFDARYGARHMASPPEGRARHWSRFCTAIEAAAFTPDARAMLVAGAQAEFERFAKLLDRLD